MSNPFSDDPQWNPYQGPQSPMGQPAYGPQFPQPKPASGLAIASMVLGIVSLSLLPFFCCWPVTYTASFVCAVTGEALGWIAYTAAKQGKTGGEGMALTGLVTSAVTLGLFALALVSYLFVIVASISGM